MIENVEELCTKLQCAAFVKFEVLENGKVNIVDSGTADGIASGVAKREEWNTATLGYVGAVVRQWIEIEVAGNSIARATQATSTDAAVVNREAAIRTSIECLYFAHHIRAVQTAGLLALIVVGKDGEGSAGLERRDPASASS